MEDLYNKIVELLQEIPELKWIDLDVGQLNEPTPSVTYPCALIEIDMPKTDDIQENTQQVSARFKITIAVKAYGETNGKTAIEKRSNALSYFKIANNCFKKLQGFGNENFYAFSRTSQRPENFRKGIKVIVQNYETSWNDYSAN